MNLKALIGRKESNCSSEIGSAEAKARKSISRSTTKNPVFTRDGHALRPTYMVLAPEHSLIDLIVTEEQWPAVRDYRKRLPAKAISNGLSWRRKDRRFYRAYAINRSTTRKFNLDRRLCFLGYGTARSWPCRRRRRDLEFARKFNLPIRSVSAAGR